MRKSTTAPNTAERVSIQISYSPFIRILATALFAGSAGWLLWWMAAAVFSGMIWLAITGAVVAIVVVPVLLSLLPSIVHAWAHQGPVVILDAEGVTDLRKKGANQSIGWSNVGQIQLGAGNTASHLAFEFRRPDRQKQDGSAAGGLATLFNRAQFLYDWNISLRMLSCNPQEVLKGARRLHQQHLRRRTQALNQFNQFNQVNQVNQVDGAEKKGPQP